MSDVELVWDGQDSCGEAPAWDTAAGRLLWMDISGGKLHSLTLEAEQPHTIELGISASGLTLNHAGGLVLGGERGLIHWRNPSDYVSIAEEVDGEPLAINDLIADSAGRVYAGTLFWGENGMEKPGKLYLIQDGKRPTVVDDGIQLANGLGLSPDDRTLYFADSAARAVYAYDVNSADGSLSRRRKFAWIPAEEGIPDGLTVDSEGFVWCAMWYGAQVIRFDPGGNIERKIPLPVSQVSSVAFGGEDLATLYITTAAEPWPSPLEPPGFDWNARPAGGALYACRPGFAGKPDHLADFRVE